MYQSLLFSISLSLFSISHSMLFSILRIQFNRVLENSHCSSSQSFWWFFVFADLIFSVFSLSLWLWLLWDAKGTGKDSKTDFIKVKEVQHSFQLPVMLCTLSGMPIQKSLPWCQTVKMNMLSWIFMIVLRMENCVMFNFF